jgi:CIC family chloride channel protein
VKQLRFRREGALAPQTLVLCLLGAGLGLAAGVIARVLALSIAFVTNVAFFHRFTSAPVSPAANVLGAWVIVVPVIGGLVVGLMAKYGSQAIRGHGIPEAMERVLLHRSQIPARLTWLKPLSAAIAIGTGGPFGAEGPIIATGGAVGSLVGQFLRVTASERKTLLAAGAAAGMTATFGTPVAAVLLAVELLLFEYRPRSLLPVIAASSVAGAVRVAQSGTAPAFAMPAVAAAHGPALALYAAIGVLVGLASVVVTRALYAIEDHFEHLPLSSTWWPAIGGIVVGVVGWISPRTLGVGYDNIDALVDGHLVATAALVLGLFKLVSWSIALGSGTSGGTLAPLFTIGGALGAFLGGLAAPFVGGASGFDARVAALVGMSAMFAGASRALLASVVFAFETTGQAATLAPLLIGGSASFLVSALLMKHSIMTERMARRGTRASLEYGVDPLVQSNVRDAATMAPIFLRADEPVGVARDRLEEAGVHHQGFAVVERVDDVDLLLGVATRRELDASDGAVLVRALVRTPAHVAFLDESVRDAADRMIAHGIGRLPVVAREAPRVVVGMLTRSDLLAVQAEANAGDQDRVRLRRLPLGLDGLESLGAKV